MYITKLYNVVGDDYSIHQYVMKLFPGNRPLFQVNGSVVTTSSNTVPIGIDNKFIKEISVNSKIGDVHLFTLRISPKKHNGITGKYTSIDNSLIPDWIKSKAIVNGFNIEDMNIKDEGTRVHEEPSKTKIIRKIRSVFVTGMLTVQDTLKFNNSICNGLSGCKYKYIGFGMLNIF